MAPLTIRATVTLIYFIIIYRNGHLFGFGWGNCYPIVTLIVSLASVLCDRVTSLDDRVLPRSASPSSPLRAASLSFAGCVEPGAPHGAPRQESGLVQAQMSAIHLTGEACASSLLGGAPRRETGLAGNNLLFASRKTPNAVREKPGRSGGGPPHARVIPHRIGARIGTRGP